MTTILSIAALAKSYGPVQALRGVSFEAARRLVKRLEDEDVLQEITGRRRNRVYAAREVIEVLEGPLI